MRKDEFHSSSLYLNICFICFKRRKKDNQLDEDEGAREIKRKKANSCQNVSPLWFRCREAVDEPTDFFTEPDVSISISQSAFTDIVCLSN